MSNQLKKGLREDAGELFQALNNLEEGILNVLKRALKEDAGDPVQALNNQEEGIPNLLEKDLKEDKGGTVQALNNQELETEEEILVKGKKMDMCSREKTFPSVMPINVKLVE